MFKKLLNIDLKNVITVTKRYKAGRFYDKSEGIIYPGFRYYPRFPNEEDDPNFKPSKLFMVKRVHRVKGCPYWEKNILKQLKLDGNDVAILKNIPEVNAKLWQIKHLIKITPINFLDGLPTEEDIKANATYLRENGDFMIAKKIDVTPNRIEAAEKFIEDTKKLDGNTLRRQSRMKWVSGW